MAALIGNVSTNTAEPVLVENVHVKNGIMTSTTDHVAGIVGYATTNTDPLEIRNVSVKDVKIIGSQYVAGILGEADGDGGSDPNIRIDNVVYDNQNDSTHYIKADSFGGGIVGGASSVTISKAYSRGKLLINNSTGASTTACISNTACYFGGITGGAQSPTYVGVFESLSRMSIYNTEAAGYAIKNVGGVIGALQGMSASPGDWGKVVGSKYDGSGIHLTNSSNTVVNVGGIVGELSNYAQLDQCIMTATTIDGSSQGDFIGGAAGRLPDANGYILRTTVKETTVEGNQYIGGIAGASTGNINESVSHTVDLQPGSTHAGGLAGLVNGGNVTDNYIDIQVIPLPNGGAGTNYTGGVFGQVSSSPTILRNALNYRGLAYSTSSGGNPYSGLGAGSSSVVLNSGGVYLGLVDNGNSIMCGNTTIGANVYHSGGYCSDASPVTMNLSGLGFSDTTWVGADSTTTDNANGLPMLDVEVARNFHGYAIGTREDPIIVNTPTKFQAIGDNDHSLSRVYKLQGDVNGEIDFNLFSLTPIGGNGGPPFTGTIIPDGVKLKNITMTDSTNSNVGIFGAVGEYTGSHFRRGEIGFDHDPLVVENLTVAATGSPANTVGGIIGTFVSGRLAVKVVNGNVSSSSTFCQGLGGLVGYTGATAIDSHWDQPEIINSIYDGDITDSKCYTGGLVGYNETVRIRNSMAVGTITQNAGGQGLGGLVGRVRGFANSTNGFNLDAEGVVSKVEFAGTTALDVGGFAGSVEGKTNIRNSYVISKSSVTGAADLAGMFGNIGGSGAADVHNVYLFESATYSTGGGGTIRVGHAVNGGTTNYSHVLAYNPNGYAADSSIESKTDYVEFVNRLNDVTRGDFWSTPMLRWETEDPYATPHAHSF